MGKIIRNGIEFSGTSDSANNINYDNSVSGLEARTAQEAIDQLNDSLGGLRFGTDGDGNYGYYGADDSLIPFKSLPTIIEWQVRSQNAVQKNSHTHTLNFVAPETDFNAIITHGASSGSASITDYSVSSADCDVDSVDASIKASEGSRVFLLKVSNAVKGESVTITLNVTMDGSHYSDVTLLTLT